MRLGKSCPSGIKGSTRGVRTWLRGTESGLTDRHFPCLKNRGVRGVDCPAHGRKEDTHDDERDRLPQARAPDGQGCLREGPGSLAGEARRALEEAYSRAEGARAEGGCRPQPATVARRRDQGLAPRRLAAAASGRGGEGRGV